MWLAHKIDQMTIVAQRKPATDFNYVEEWAKILATVCANVVKIYRERLTVIANQGYTTKYSGELL